MERNTINDYKVTTMKGKLKSPQRENFEEAKSEHKRMVEKHGKATTEVEQPDGSIAEVSGYECPECGGVRVVTPQNGQYPPYEKKCLGDCE